MTPSARRAMRQRASDIVLSRCAASVFLGSRKPSRYGDAGAPGPGRNVALQEHREPLGDRRQLPTAVSNLIEVRHHSGIHETRHDDVR